MKNISVTTRFVTIRVNGELLSAKAIQEDYSYVQFFIENIDFNKSNFKELEDSKCAKWLQNDVLLVNEIEAKDLYGTYGSVVISFEDIEVPITKFKK